MVQNGCNCFEFWIKINKWFLFYLSKGLDKLITINKYNTKIQLCTFIVFLFIQTSRGLIRSKIKKLIWENELLDLNSISNPPELLLQELLANPNQK